MSIKAKKKNGDELSWNIIESYFEGKHLERLVRHQIESYNHFVTKQLKKTIDILIQSRFIQRMIRM